MHCLVCGHKLAIFRRLSSGDFCCPEHRALFLKEQSDRGLACLVEARSETQASARNQGAGTRVYAQFLPEELQATHSNAGYCSYGPLAPALLMAPKTPDKAFSKLAPGRALMAVTPEIGITLPVAYGLAPGLRMKFPPKVLPVWNGVAGTRLRPAGLILPWSSGAPHATFSLSPLVAAAWAQSGNCRPIASHGVMRGELTFAWPAIEGNLELPPQEAGIAAAAYAVEAPAVQSMRVRLDLPSVAPPKPRLAMPPAVIEEIQAPEPVFAESTAPEAVPAVVASPPAQGGWLSWLFPARTRPVRVRPRASRRARDQFFGYDEPAPIVTSNSSDAWRAMLAGWKPSAVAASGVFAILFLFSALAIFFSAPDTLTQRSPSWRWGNLRSAIRNRSVMRLEDDFRSGLNRWVGPAGWSQDWSYDQAGFLRPGKLGFLQQSMSLVNYRLELMGQIERKSLGWAFRAKDDHNYYVAKLTIAKPGPLPMVDLIRYSVTEGKESSKIRVPLPFAVRNDTLYQVEMNIRGDQFRASVNGHVVDSWSDGRLQAGGVGFINGQGEASRVRWIRVSDKDDVIGRVCSFLTARYEPAGGPVLSASYYSLLHFPGNPADF
jgi:hypothetical protein